LRKRIETNIVHAFYLSLFLLADEAIAMVLVIIRVHRSSILSSRSKVVVVVMLVFPFFSHSLSTSLCSVSSSFFSSSVRALELRRILKWSTIITIMTTAAAAAAVRHIFFFL
jgi:hypothetical protein